MWYEQKKQEQFLSTLAFASLEQTRNFDAITNKVNSIFKDTQETYYILAGGTMLMFLANSRSILKSEDDNANLDLITKRFMLQMDTLAGVFSEGVVGLFGQDMESHEKFSKE